MCLLKKPSSIVVLITSHWNLCKFQTELVWDMKLWSPRYVYIVLQFKCTTPHAGGIAIAENVNEMEFDLLNKWKHMLLNTLREEIVSYKLRGEELIDDGDIYFELFETAF